MGCVAELQLHWDIRSSLVCRPIVPILRICVDTHSNRGRAGIGIGDGDSYHKRSIAGVVCSGKGGEGGFVGSSQL